MHKNTLKGITLHEKIRRVLNLKCKNAYTFTTDIDTTVSSLQPQGTSILFWYSFLKVR